ncbi:hypothetical protein BT63DRAFT_424305 [Microthyrium microscopicum]|uniref:Large ribosomal subunit protein mL67 n=1 Tax=Microthyrium microscopicum TaxID=703497 RepID=A0A6A6UDJ0_9PEZI|nr:hypothetical protein BT63DRAFT_424305 [Microthyrium microscopicum]
MPRLRHPHRNFKVRQAKFLGLHHLKYNSAGTYTGFYKGLPISQRRLQYIKKLQALERRKVPNLPLLNNVVGTPMSKSLPLWTQDVRNQNQVITANKRDVATLKLQGFKVKHKVKGGIRMFRHEEFRSSSIYLFSHVVTNQVLYSMTAHIDPAEALPSLTFYGKKTVPAKIRKDNWRPYAVANFSSPDAALLAFTQLRELRMLRDYGWRKLGTHGPNKDKRKKLLMDQRGSSVCDLSTVIVKLNETYEYGDPEDIAQWKAVEALAAEAEYGALSTLKRQIRRAQIILQARRRSKRFRRPEALEQVRIALSGWYKKQTMMYRAMAAVKKVGDARKAAQPMIQKQIGMKIFEVSKINKETGRKRRDVGRRERAGQVKAENGAEMTEKFETTLVMTEEFQEELAAKVEAFVTSMVDGQAKSNEDGKDSQQLAKENDSAAKSKTGSKLAEELRKAKKYPFETPEYSAKYGIRVTVPLPDLVGKMAQMQAKQVLDGIISTYHPGRRRKVRTPRFNPRTQNLFARTIDGYKPYRAPDATAAPSDTEVSTNLPGDPIDIFWVDPVDRKFTTGWPENTTHQSMGPLMGRDQYVFHSPSWYAKNRQAWDPKDPDDEYDMGKDYYIGDDAIDEDIKPRLSKAQRVHRKLPEDPKPVWRPLGWKDIKMERKRGSPRTRDQDKEFKKHWETKKKAQTERQELREKEHTEWVEADPRRAAAEKAALRSASAAAKKAAIHMGKSEGAAKNKPQRKAIRAEYMGFLSELTTRSKSVRP